MNNSERKLKIILVNYRYFISGGPERYLFNIKSKLEDKGHTVIPFSIKHNNNLPTEYSSYFLDPIGTGNETYGHEYKNNLKTIIKVFSRMVYSFEAKRKFKKLLRSEKPDIVYILQFQNKISCSIIDAAYALKIPIVQRISDFSHICIDAIFYHYQTKTICEKCLHGTRMNAILKKCSNNSFTASTMKVFALFIHDILRTRSKISSFVIPANFTAQKFVEYGIPKEKIFHIPTYFNFKKHSHENIDYGDYFLYIGRIVPEKGLFTLINAFIDTDFKLKIVGYSMDGYDKVLKDYLIDKEHNITFTGELEFSEIEPLLEKCICTICPSEWYDNFPNSVLESYAFKKPVIASRLGSLTELVEANKTGLHFEPGNYLSLRNAIDYMNKNREEVKNFGENGYQLLKELFSENYHYIRLIEVFKKAIEN